MSAGGNGPNLLEVRGLTKIFGTLKACDDVDLTIRKGEIHALLGENGAGKSTLVKMLFGSLEPYSGEILWNGKPVKISSPSVAKKLGIGMVFQHFSLFEALSAAENIALSLDDETPISTIAAKAQALSYSYGLPLDPYSLVGDLSVGERQRIEIIRCLLQTPDLIILDEPTSVLTPQEADKLFETLERLRSEGKSILYISHRLEEVKRMCDAATVMRHGKVVGHCDPRKETAASLARMMVGTEVQAVVRAPVEGIDKAEPLLEIKQPQPQAGDTLLDAAAQHLAQRSGRRGDRHRRRRRQRPGRVLRGRVRRGDAAGRRHDPHPRQGCRPAVDHRPPPARRGLRAGGAARPWRSAAHEAVGESFPVALRDRPQGLSRRRRPRQGRARSTRRPSASSK